MAKQKKQAKTQHEQEYFRQVLTYYISTMDLPQTRVLGSAPPRNTPDAASGPQKRFDPVLDRLHKELISS